MEDGAEKHLCLCPKEPAHGGERTPDKNRTAPLAPPSVPPDVASGQDWKSKISSPLPKPEHVEGEKIRVCLKSEDVFGVSMR